MPPLRSVIRAVLAVVIIAGLYGLVRIRRDELVDFAVPHRAAVRFLTHEPLYRAPDGHYQYKYLPTFAAMLVPFTWVPKRAAEAAWFALTVIMAWGFVRLSIAALPDRRLPARVLFWLVLLINGKFLVRELAYGQFNLPMALLLLGAMIAARHGRGLIAGCHCGRGVHQAVCARPVAVAGVDDGLAIGGGVRVGAGRRSALPVLSYGWHGNLTLLHEWYRTVTETTRPNLLGADNISFASMWTKWLGPGPAADRLALAPTAIAVAAGFVMMARRRVVAEPDYLEGAYFLFLVALLSPQGWDYVLLIGLPAYVCLVDRWFDLSPRWRTVAGTELSWRTSRFTICSGDRCICT